MGEDIKQFLSSWYDDSDSIVAHTSGSTGVPKEINLKKCDMVVSAKATCRYFGLDSSSHLVMPLSVSYIAGKMMVVRSLVCGARLSVIPPSRTLDGLDNIDTQIDLLPIVPSQIDGLLASKNLARIKNIIIGGAPMSVAQEEAITAAGINAYATYGMTETCSHVALRRIGGDGVFEAMPDISFSVDEDDCLIIEAPGYSSRWFATNDIVELVDDRHFRWLGRRDNVINSGGIKIIPEEVEALLRPFMGDMEYYITSRKGQKWGEEVILVVAGGEDVTSKLEKARQHLSHHLLPKDVIYVDALQYTYNGKIKRKHIIMPGI